MQSLSDIHLFTIHLLEQNMDNVNWVGLSENPNAIHILKKNINKINWHWIYKNSNAIHMLFTYDYLLMKKKMSLFAENLAQYVFHPSRLLRLCEKYEISLYDYNEIIG